MKFVTTKKAASPETEKVVPIEKQSQQPAEYKPPIKPKTRRTSAAAKPTPQEKESAREPFSTRLRADIIRRLKDAAYHRERKGIEPNTIQAMIEEALTSWLEKAEEQT